MPKVNPGRLGLQTIKHQTSSYKTSISIFLFKKSLQYRVIVRTFLPVDLANTSFRCSNVRYREVIATVAVWGHANFQEYSVHYITPWASAIKTLPPPPPLLGLILWKLSILATGVAKKKKISPICRGGGGREEYICITKPRPLITHTSLGVVINDGGGEALD